MQKIDVYIETKFEGSFANGTGTYALILEVIKDNIPYTKNHAGGYLETTNHRLDIYTVIHALKCIKEPCEIEIHIYSPYVVGTINNHKPRAWSGSGWKNGKSEVKNADIWEEYLKHSEQHLITATCDKRTNYSDVLRADIKKNQKINYIKDYRRENEI